MIDKNKRYKCNHGLEHRFKHGYHNASDPKNVSKQHANSPLKHISTQVANLLLKVSFVSKMRKIKLTALRDSFDNFVSVKGMTRHFPYLYSYKGIVQ